MSPPVPITHFFHFIREGIAYSVELANYFSNTQQPVQHDLIPTWKILEEQEYTIRLGEPRPFQTSVTRGSPVFLRTYCLGTITNFPMEGGFRTYSTVPNSSTALCMALENCCSSNQPCVHAETTEDKGKLIYLLRTGTFFQLLHLIPMWNGHVCACLHVCYECVCIPIAMEQPCMMHVMCKLDFSIWFFFLTESRASTESSFNKNNAMQMNLNQKN